MAKETKEHMAPTQETQSSAPAKKSEVIVRADKKQPITVLNLDTNEEESLTLILPVFKINEKAPIEAQLKAAGALVQPPTEQVKALVRYAESKAYQDAKNDAMGKGNYLTQPIKTAITTILSNYPALADLGAKELFTRWLQGYKDGKDSAKRVLNEAKASQAMTDVDF